jgi:FkbM family methyltransferase
VLPIMRGPNFGMRWCVGSGDHGCWLGTYELDKQRAIWRRRQKGGTALDVGANAGYYTLLLSRAVGPNGKVIAIEPDTRNAEWIRFHTWINRVRNVDVVLGAASDRTGTATYSVGRTPTTGRLIADGSGEAVSAFALDDLVSAAGSDIPSIVKMDIEGGESAALAGATRLLAARRTTWFVALHSAEQADFCIPLFRRYGYRIAGPDGEELPREYDKTIGEIVAYA